MASKKSSKKTVKKKSVGRPSKKDKLDPHLVKKLAAFGLTEKQIAEAVGMCFNTFNKHKKDPKIYEPLKKGKQISDKEVVKSLYKRATGFKYTETHITAKGIKTIEKEMCPDTLACIFWLKNRIPTEWKDRRDISLPDLKDKNVKLIIKGL